MNNQTVFKRYEIKYLLTQEQYRLIKAAMEEHMTEDSHGKSTICNIYFDTPDYLLIRRSLEKPVYKEKLRLRSYGKATDDSDTFIEIKKKYHSVVYKRRILMKEQDAVNYLNHEADTPNTQIGREIDYFLQQYQDLQPSVYISYEREAFYGKDDPDFRITFDQNILWRNTDLTLRSSVYGQPVLGAGQVLMEVKTAAAIPLWLTAILSGEHIYKTSFSKYGAVYKSIRMKAQLGGVCYA